LPESRMGDWSSFRTKLTRKVRDHSEKCYEDREACNRFCYSLFHPEELLTDVNDARKRKAHTHESYCRLYKKQNRPDAGQ